MYEVCQLHLDVTNIWQWKFIRSFSAILFKNGNLSELCFVNHAVKRQLELQNSDLARQDE